MNIFVLSNVPYISACLLFDLDKVRARKQIVELCQMLACLYDDDMPKKDGTLYKKPKSINSHPATKWIGESVANSSWCIKFLYHLMCISTEDKPERHGCYGAYECLKKSHLNLPFQNLVPEFRWLTKKCEQLDPDIFKAHEMYIEAKQNGLYGNKKVVQSSREYSEQVDKMLGLVPFTIRLRQKDQFEKIEKIAKENGIGVQSLLRNIISDYVDKYED